MNQHLQFQKTELAQKPKMVGKTFRAIMMAMLIGSTSLPAFAQQAVLNPTFDNRNAATFDADAVTIKSLIGDVLSQAISTTKAHTIPGSIATLESLTNALQRDTTAAKAQAMLRIVEMNLRLINSTSEAGIVRAGARIVEYNDPNQTSMYMRGVAQDLRRAGSINAAQYLENTATLVMDGVYDPMIGVMDAAALALRFGVAPQPVLSEFLSMDITTVEDTYLQSLAADMMDAMGTLTNDEAYAGYATQIRSITEEDVETIRGIIRQAQAEQTQAAQERVGIYAEPETNSDTQNILNGNN